MGRGQSLVINKLRVIVGAILLLCGLLSLCALLFLAFHLSYELNKRHLDIESLSILGTFSAVTLFFTASGILSGSRILRFNWCLRLKPFWLGILCALGALLLGSPGTYILVLGPMSDWDTLFAWSLVLGGIGMAFIAGCYWMRAGENKQHEP